MSRFQPQIDQSRAALENKLANQGITLGSEAYNNAMQNQSQSENDLRMQAALNGINVGQNAQNQQLSLQTALQNQPLNMLNAVRTGSQVTNPSFTNVPQQQYTPGPDMLGATNAQNNYNMGLYNSQVASDNSAMNGLFGLGSAALSTGLKSGWMMSDRRAKQNISQIGNLDNGLNVYSFEYKPEFKSECGDGVFIGVMADEVNEIIPEAIIHRPDGLKMVDYSMIGA